MNEFIDEEIDDDLEKLVWYFEWKYEEFVFLKLIFVIGIVFYWVIC